jgi:hypothetical protein
MRRAAFVALCCCAAPAFAEPRGPEAEPAYAERDRAIEQRLHGAYSLVGDLQKVKVSVRASVVRLEGVTATAEARDKAGQIAAKTEGVVYVENDVAETTNIGELGFFGRYNQWNNEAGLSSMGDTRQYDIGTNFWPHPQVVLKADVALIDYPASSPTGDDEIFNLGVGFQF